MTHLATVNPCPVIAPSFVQKFFAWARCAEEGERGNAASALARAYLHSALTLSQRDDVLLAMTALLDDRCPSVRRALSEALASASDAPRHLVVALANDSSEVAAPLLLRSPLLSDAELVECVAAGDAVAQCAIARRHGLGAGPAEALAETGRREAALALVGNLDTRLARAVLRRVYERFGADAAIGEAMLARPDLPASLKAELAIVTARALCDAAVARGRLSRERAERAAIDARDAAVAWIAASCCGREQGELVRALRERGALTMALLLRSLLSGERALFAAALAELGDTTHARASAFARDPRSEGFAALMLKAGTPPHALIAFRAALEALDAYEAAEGDGLKLPLIEATIAACEARRDPALASIQSLLWRLAAEAARTIARESAHEATNERSPLPPSLDFSPANDESAAPLVTAHRSAPEPWSAAPPVGGVGPELRLDAFSFRVETPSGLKPACAAA